MFNARLVDDVVSSEEVSILLEFAQNTNAWEKSTVNFWDGRVITDRSVYVNHSKEIALLMYDIRGRVQDIILKEYDLPYIYPDLFQLIRWFPGSEQTPHCDDMSNVPNNEWHNHRDFGAVIYLNNNFTGGETYYPDHNFIVTPKPGMLALHPADPNYMHGVTKIDGGIRYTMSSFWTKDKKYHDTWNPTKLQK